MDYSTFINETSLAVEKMNNAEKTACLLNLIRSTDEEAFEQVWRIVVNGLGSEQLLDQKFEEWQKYLEQLDRLDVHFIADIFYSDDYWDDIGTCTYHDPQKIGPKLDDCIDLAKKLVFAKRYKQAKELYETLYLTPFYAYCEETEEHFEIEFEELSESEVITSNLKQFAQNYLYTLYQTTPPNKRPQNLFRAWSWRICQNVNLTELFAVGSEPLPDLQRFLDDFITFLLEIPEALAAELLLEAVKMAKTYSNEEALLQLAKKASASKPEIYLWLIDRLIQESEFERAFTIGKMALKEIPRRFTQRSKLAESLLTLVKERATSKNEILYLLQESFFSFPTVKKLFQLLTYELSPADFDRILQFVSQNPNAQQHVLLFLLQQFDSCFTKAARNRQALGWSTSDKGTIIPLFLLLFTDNTNTPAAIMLTKEVSAQCYQSDWIGFAAAFNDWKSTFQIDPKAKSKIFAWCKKEIEKREGALVQTKFRNHYARVAALLITMGEAEEALGQSGAAEKTWQKYYKKHSRKSNFRIAMRDLHAGKDENKDIENPDQTSLW